MMRTTSAIRASRYLTTAIADPNSMSASRGQGKQLLLIYGTTDEALTARGYWTRKYVVMGSAQVRLDCQWLGQYRHDHPSIGAFTQNIGTVPRCVSRFCHRSSDRFPPKRLPSALKWSHTSLVLASTRLHCLAATRSSSSFRHSRMATVLGRTLSCLSSKSGRRNRPSSFLMFVLLVFLLCNNSWLCSCVQAFQVMFYLCRGVEGGSIEIDLLRNAALAALTDYSFTCGPFRISFAYSSVGGDHKNKQNVLGLVGGKSEFRCASALGLRASLYGTRAYQRPASRISVLDAAIRHYAAFRRLLLSYQTHLLTLWRDYSLKVLEAHKKYQERVQQCQLRWSSLLQAFGRDHRRSY